MKLGIGGNTKKRLQQQVLKFNRHVKTDLGDRVFGFKSNVSELDRSQLYLIYCLFIHIVLTLRAESGNTQTMSARSSLN